MENNLLNEILEKGLSEKCREFKDLVICEFRNHIKELFERTNDLETIQKDILEFLSSYELNNFRRWR